MIQVNLFKFTLNTLNKTSSLILTLSMMESVIQNLLPKSVILLTFDCRCFFWFKVFQVTFLWKTKEFIDMIKDLTVKIDSLFVSSFIFLLSIDISSKNFYFKVSPTILVSTNNVFYYHFMVFFGIWRSMKIKSGLCLTCFFPFLE